MTDIGFLRNALLPVRYPDNRIGEQWSLRRDTAKGMIIEITSAAESFTWARDMTAYMDRYNAIHPDVLEFYTMGDMPTDPDGLNNWTTYEEKSEIARRVEQYFKGLIHRAGIPRKTKLHREFAFRDADRALSGNDLISSAENCALFTDEITIQTTWGIRFLFQAFSLRKIGDEWYLWPFSQPNMNNRQINVDQFLWNHKSQSPSMDQMIPAIFGKTTRELSTQQVYCVPYITEMARHDDGGMPLGAMIDGVSSTDEDEFKFDDVHAFKCTRKHLEDCFKVLTVRLLFSSLRFCGIDYCF